MTRPEPRGLALLLLAALAALTCAGPDKTDETGEAGPAQSARSPDDTKNAAKKADDGAPFTERAAETGLDFAHWNGMTGSYFYVEVMGSGLALLDYDRDGDLDVYFAQGRLLGRGASIEDAVFPPPEVTGDRLYRNDLDQDRDSDLEGRSGALTFTDVTDSAGLDMHGYGMGVASGDFDDDGWPDLYVTQFGAANRLLRNRGDGTFEDVTERAGVGEGRWSVAAVFFDADLDGLLDLYVGNYLDYTTDVDKQCFSPIGLRDYCGPAAFPPAPDVFYRNLGGGRFTDATGAAGFLHPAAPVLGAVSGDFNADGLPDLYLANDAYPNNLLIQQPGGTFSDQARLSGAAMNAAGYAEAGMGIAVGDADGDGDEDLFLSHLTGETNTLYLADPEGLFSDRTAGSGLGPASFEATGFGTHFLDYDNDGKLDLLVTNGAVQGIHEQVAAGSPYPLAQRDRLFRGLGGGRFEDVTDAAGAPFKPLGVGRGAAFGDLDNDGDTDVVISQSAGPARLLLNQVGQDASWIGLRLVLASGRDALGAEAELLAPGPAQIRRVRTDGSYASASDPRLLFGLGELEDRASFRVTWPGGRVETFEDLPLGTYHQLSPGDSGDDILGAGEIESGDDA